ncbi:MAG: N-acetylmuramoyl-L-alanine amidase family protein, partial [Candidatus Caldatribacteriaceae bacterium]
MFHLKMTREPACHLFKFLLVSLIGFFFLSGPAALAGVEVNLNGQSFVSQARTKVVNGTSYVVAEELFQDLGGIAYYSPIMKKVHLRLGRTMCTISLDKKTIVMGEEELPLPERDVLIERNTAYLSLRLLSQLFSMTFPSEAPARVETESPSPQPVETAPPSPSLVGIRYYAYEDEARTRITLDFSGVLPSYSYQIDRSNGRLDVVLRNCNLQNVPAVLAVNDRRVSRIETRKEADRMVISVFLAQMVGVKEGRLPGGPNPRIYFDLTSLVEVETKPVTPTPLSTPGETPQKEVFPEKTATPAPEIGDMNRLNFKAIVIDPGHGGKDPGCVQNGYQEKEIVLKVAQLLKGFLEREGFQVFMTRSGDTYPTLEERYALVNKTVPLVFVSIHCNAAPNPSASGIEVFVGNSRPKGEGALDVANRENELFLAEKKGAESHTAIDSLLASAYYLTSREASLNLGKMVIEKVAARTGQVKRGNKEAPLVVLRNIYSPALLVEIGFLSNPK